LGLADAARSVRGAYTRLTSFRRQSGSLDAGAGGDGEAAPSAQTASDAPLTQNNEPLRPGLRLYAVGDVHGRADLLDALIGKIETDSADFEGDIGLIFLGDYVDRGFQSRQVIEILLSERLEKYETSFLKGNHEDAMLSFVSDHTFGPKWAAFGGRETLVSYGIRPPKSMSLNGDWKRAHTEFVAALPKEHELFLMSLPTSLQVGPYGFVHAGLRPGVPFAEQSDKDRLWIRDEFLKSSQKADVFVVHGHTPSDQPFVDNRRINVDTGAYFTGRLTAVKLEGDEVAFLSTDI